MGGGGEPVGGGGSLRRARRARNPESGIRLVGVRLVSPPLGPSEHAGVPCFAAAAPRGSTGSRLPEDAPVFGAARGFTLTTPGTSARFRCFSAFPAPIPTPPSPPTHPPSPPPFTRCALILAHPPIHAARSRIGSSAPAFGAPIAACPWPVSPSLSHWVDTQADHAMYGFRVAHSGTSETTVWNDPQRAWRAPCVTRMPWRSIELVLTRFSAFWGFLRGRKPASYITGVRR